MTDNYKAAPRVATQSTRTKVLRDQRLPPLPLTFVSYYAEEAARAAMVQRVFEQGGITVMDDNPLPVDKHYLRSLPVWPACDQHSKKPKMAAMLAPLPADMTRHLLGHLFGRDRAKATIFQAKVAKVSGHMQRLARALFPSYRFVKEAHTWRLVETFPEGLHCDSYAGQEDELVRVRLFVNYDDVPRIWAMTHAAPELYRRYWPLLKAAGATLSMHPNLLNALLNTHVPWQELPRHYVFFAPGALWIGDTQLLSHEIFYGRRGWAYTFAAESGSMSDPQASFQRRVRAALATLT